MLAVDTAKVSGWAFVDSRGHTYTMAGICGEPLSGVCLANSISAVDEVVKRAETYAELLGIPKARVVLVLEAPWGGKRHIMFGLGKAHGVWEAVWSSRKFAASHIVKVKPRVWRKAVLGRDRGSALHQAEQMAAKMAYGYGPYSPSDFPQDQAAAICIAVWASTAPQVSSKLPRKRAPRRASKRKAA